MTGRDIGTSRYPYVMPSLLFYYYCWVLILYSNRDFLPIRLLAISRLLALASCFLPLLARLSLLVLLARTDHTAYITVDNT